MQCAPRRAVKTWGFAMHAAVAAFFCCPATMCDDACIRRPNLLCPQRRLSKSSVFSKALSRLSSGRENVSRTDELNSYNEYCSTNTVPNVLRMCVLNQYACIRPCQPFKVCGVGSAPLRAVRRNNRRTCRMRSRSLCGCARSPNTQCPVGGGPPRSTKIRAPR